MNTFIYILIDPTNQQIRYVGKANNPKKRYYKHINEYKDNNTHKRNWINSLKLKGYLPEIEIIDEIDVKEWKYWEKFWVQYYKSIGADLTNHCGGGEGLSFGNQTSFKKGNISWNTGKKMSVEFGEKIRIRRLGKKASKETKIRQSIALIGKNKGKKHKAKSIEIMRKTFFNEGHIPWNKGVKIRLKPPKTVYQYNKDTGNYIRSWLTARDASNTLNINEESIGQNCRGKSKSAGGWIWSYMKIDCMLPIIGNNYPKNRKSKICKK